MTDHDQHPEDPALAEARRRLAGLAMGLVARFGSSDAIQTMLGAAIGLVIATGADRPDAAKWLRLLADEIEQDEDQPIVGHG